jgi:sugar phosphate isomerase/epimerase
LARLARELAFDGIEWTLTGESLPRTPAARAALAAEIAALDGLEVRYHLAFRRADLGHEDLDAAREAMRRFREVLRLVAELGGKVVTIHVGLGRDTTHDLSWERTLGALAHLVRFAEQLGLRLCLENLAWGWTSRPELFEKLLRKSGCWATLDVGHARVSPSITSQHFNLEDFTTPHPERFLNAHIYHEENDHGHVAPGSVKEIATRLRLLRNLPACDWWVLELREEEPLRRTREVVERFLDQSPEA